MILDFFALFLYQDVVLSPVQEEDNKPQIDSNKGNNYNIVKEVISFFFPMKKKRGQRMIQPFL